MLHILVDTQIHKYRDTEIHTHIHTLHYITLRYITLHDVTLHYITLICITLHYIHIYMFAVLHIHIHTYAFTYRYTYTYRYLYRIPTHIHIYCTVCVHIIHACVCRHLCICIYGIQSEISFCIIVPFQFVYCTISIECVLMCMAKFYHWAAQAHLRPFSSSLSRSIHE